MSFRTSLHKILRSPHSSSRGNNFDAPDGAVERLSHLTQSVYTFEQVLLCYLASTSRKYARIIRMDDTSCHCHSYCMHIDAAEGVMTIIESQKSTDFLSGVAAGLTSQKCNVV